MDIKSLITQKRILFLIICVKCLKQNRILFVFLLNFHAQKLDIDLSKIFSWEKIFIKSPYYERKKRKKKKYPPLSPTTPSHITKTITFWKTKKTPTFQPWKRTKLFPPMPPKKQPLEIVPHPPKKSLLPIPPKKILHKRVELFCLPFPTQKKSL